MRSLRILLFAFFALSAEILCAQRFSLSGKITDGRNRQPLAFVNVVINEGQSGCMSDINGKYAITADEPILKVRFSSIGYETKELVLQPDTKQCNITLTPLTVQLQEVTVEAGENPAHRIIDSLMAHRKGNHPNSLDSYRYQVYDQMVFTIDSSDFDRVTSTSEIGGELKMFDSILKKNDFMVMETASEVLFMSPDKKRQNVLGTKIAGMKDPTFIYLANSLQSVTFYDETVNIAGQDYVNPISRGSKRHYFFTLEAVEPIGQGDSIYMISFHPRQGSTFKGLRGTMSVNSNGWALQSVKASPNEAEGLFTVGIQQLYEKVESHWFPKQLNILLKFPGILMEVDGQRFPMAAIGKSYLSGIEINPDLDRKQFSNIEINVEREASYRTDEFWTAHRIDSLTERVKATYLFVDSLTAGSDILDRTMNLTSKLMEGTIPIGPINLDIDNIINVSGTRGFYFGLGFSTNKRFSRFVSLNGFGGYWTRLHSADYGGGITLNLNPQRQMTLSAQVAHKSVPIGEFRGFQESYSTLSENDYKYILYENAFARQNSATLSFTSRFAQHFKAFLSLKSAHKRYLKHYFLVPSDSLAEGQFAEAEVKIRFAYKEKFLSTPEGLRSLGTVYPEMWLIYQRAFPGLLGSQFSYDRIKFQATQNIYTPYMGVAKIMLQAGYASESCPVMETFDLIGTNTPISLYAPGSFSTMQPDEFFCDRFVALFLSHNFSGMLWKTNLMWFKPELTLVTNLGWGDMRRADACPDKNFKTMEKGYFESGFVVKGLLSLPTMKLGAGVFYRYGAYASERVWDNFALKWSATFSF